jgi:glucokinase
MSTPWVVGVDVGGTNVVVGLVSVETGEVVSLRSRATEAFKGADRAVANIARMAKGAIAETLKTYGCAEDDVVGMGIGSPGPLNMEAGIVLDAFNLGWKDFPLRDRLSEAVGLPASLDNDANCATYGEWWQGAGKGASSLVGVTLGTGIGGGVILNGRLVHGISGSAGEIGHTTINVAGRRCKCGNYGCLEAYASGPNIAARAVEGLEAGAESVLEDLVQGDLDAITAVTVYEALVLGDSYAHEVMLETAKLLGAGISNSINTLNPEVVVIVGGVTRAGDHLFVPLRSEVRRRAFKSSVAACSIVPGALPETAGAIGAAGIFMSQSSLGGVTPIGG